MLTLSIVLTGRSLTQVESTLIVAVHLTVADQTVFTLLVDSVRNVLLLLK